MSSDWYNRTDLSLPAMGAWNMPPVIVGVSAFSISGRCPSCNSRLGYDAFEDMYTCHGCYEFFYPEEVAVMDPKLAAMTALIPCEPYEAQVYDINQDRVVKCRVTGYHVAIREIANFQMPTLLIPINTCNGARHGIIVGPAFEPIEDPVLTAVGR